METRWMSRTSGDLAELREASKGVCVIPMGCIEKHGLHLPLGTDVLAAEYIAYEASQLETVCVFPDYIFGDIQGCGPNENPGNVSVSVELEMRLLEELCDNIARNGFHKIVVYNGHGGNWPWLKTFLRMQGHRKRDWVLVAVDCALPAPHELAEYLLEHGPGSIPELNAEDEALILKYHEQKMHIGHACFSETAFMLDICPETVHMDRLKPGDGLSTHAADYLAQAGIQMTDSGWSVNYPNAYSGDDPFGCNSRIGRATVRFEAERTAHAYKVLKDDENLLRWLDERQKGW